MRHILMTLVWASLLQGGWTSAADWGRSVEPAAATDEVIPAGPATIAGGGRSTRGSEIPDYRAGDDAGDTVIGAQENPGQGLFGESAPGACEFCGGGNCLPPAWSVDAGVALIGTDRANNRTLGINSQPGGPFQVTTGTISGQPLQYAFLNNVSQVEVLAVHTPNLSDSPALDITVRHYLGRDGEKRDYFMEFEYSGLERFYGEADVPGTMVPVYSTTTTNISQIVLTSAPPIIVLTGSLISPFAFPTPNLSTSPFNPTTQQTFNATNAYAFNGATHMEVSTWSTFNNWELNVRVAGNNQPDQMVLNPNGHWYRQCKTGYFYNYLFGLRAMVIDEKYEFNASGTTFDPAMNPIVVTNGRYVARTSNMMLGLQTGGSLEYRLCRWAVEAHGKVGMFVNVANQDSLLQTSINPVNGANPDYLGTGAQINTGNNSTAFNAGNTGAAFAGGFGVEGSYKFRPNLVGRVSYDMFWVGDLARASDQLDFQPVIAPLINTHGNQFFDGVRFGLEYDW